ncbi:hypothetical protein AHAS_Ahas13G0356800 [Arachis hypogaea]
MSKLFSHLKQHNENTKLAEIEAIGLNFLRRIHIKLIIQYIMSIYRNYFSQCKMLVELFYQLES